MEADEQAVVVIDTGTGTTKCGFAGDDAPRSIFRTIVGKPRVPGIMVGTDLRDTYVGEEAIEKRGLMNVSHPIKRRLIENWDEMERVWHHAFYNQLKIAPEDHPILLSESPLNPFSHKERTLEIMFETFTVPALYCEVQATLGLFASGKTIGLVVDSGEGITHTVPVYEGYTCVHAVNKLEIAGRDITALMRNLLDDRGYSFTTPKELDIVQIAKEKLCYVSEDYSNEVKAQEDTGEADVFYELPDKHSILVSAERFKAPEALFDPSKNAVHDDGVHHKVYQSIMKCDQDVRKEMYDNILLVGGSTLLPGLKERLRKEVQALAPVGTRPKVIDPLEREFTVWIGGSVLASLSSFQRMCITKQQYDEQGSRILKIKS
jgi:actin-related protein